MNFDYIPKRIEKKILSFLNTLEGSSEFVNLILPDIDQSEQFDANQTTIVLRRIGVSIIRNKTLLDTGKYTSLKEFVDINSNVEGFEQTILDSLYNAFNNENIFELIDLYPSHNTTASEILDRINEKPQEVIEEYLESEWSQKLEFTPEKFVEELRKDFSFLAEQENLKRAEQEWLSNGIPIENTPAPSGNAEIAYTDILHTIELRLKIASFSSIYHVFKGNYDETFILDRTEQPYLVSLVEVLQNGQRFGYKIVVGKGNSFKWSHNARSDYPFNNQTIMYAPGYRPTKEDRVTQAKSKGIFSSLIKLHEQPLASGVSTKFTYKMERAWLILIPKSDKSSELGTAIKDTIEDKLIEGLAAGAGLATSEFLSPLGGYIVKAAIPKIVELLKIKVNELSQQFNVDQVLNLELNYFTNPNTKMIPMVPYYSNRIVSSLQFGEGSRLWGTGAQRAQFRLSETFWEVKMSIGQNPPIPREIEIATNFEAEVRYSFVRTGAYIQGY